MPLLLIPLDCTLPAIQEYLAGPPDEQLSAAQARAAAQLLERCVRTGEALVAFALQVGGRPSSN